MKWRIARAIIAATAAILLIRLVPPADVFGVLVGCDAGWLLLAAFLLLAATAIGTIGYRRLLAARGANARFAAVLTADLAGHFYALSVPGGVAIGGAMRVLRLAGPGASMASVLSAIIASRLLDVACGALVAIAVFPFIAHRFESPGMWILLLVGLLVAALLVYALMRSRGVRRRLEVLLGRSRRAPKLVRRWVRAGILRLQRMAGVNARLEYGTVPYFLARHLVGGAALSALLWSAQVDISFGAVLWARVVTGFAMLLPLSIAGIGIREGSLILLLAPFDVSPASALAVSLVLLCYQLLLGAIGGLIELAAGLAPPSATDAERRSTDSNPR